MHDQPNVYCDRAELVAMARLVIAADAFDDTINFYMDDEAWDAIEEVQAASDAAREALVTAGYAHLLAAQGA